jgi:EAL domain-containing protein (putative c-di-GMP-specific phosphodiesterase class I)
LRRLRDLGITLAIDDFGTGYSSLSYLQKLPVSSVKIDQSFVREIRDDSTSTIPVIQAIVDLAHGMGLKVVAEGVETELQLHTLRVLGCDSLQGYLIRRPGRPSEIEEILATTTNSLLRLDDQIRGRELEHPVASPTPILIR